MVIVLRVNTCLPHVILMVSDLPFWKKICLDSILVI